MDKKIVLACDLGGTNLRMAAIDSAGDILYRTRRKTPKTEVVEDILSALTDAAQECCDFLQTKESILAIAIAAPATVNSEEGIIHSAPNLPALNGFRLTNSLEKEFQIKTILENDANAAAVGENWLGASKGFSTSVCVTLGTGVGGGLIINGKVLSGIDGTAGEIGHICVEPFGTPCGCGSRGCLEQYASATAVARQTLELAPKYPESELARIPKLNSKNVYDKALQGDELALEVFRRQGFYLGIVLSGIINLLNPEVIVIGGGAAEGWKLFAPHLQSEIEKRTWREPRLRAQIRRAALGDDAGILGAAKLAFTRFEEGGN